MSLQIAAFQVFPKHVGVWEGKWVVLDADCQERQRFTAILTQRIVDNQWLQTNCQTYADGRSETQTFIGTIAGAGQIQIESPDPPFCNYITLAEEYSERYILFQIWDKATQTLRAIELINLTSDSTRVRTTQSFTSTGELRGVMVITEQKIADA